MEVYVELVRDRGLRTSDPDLGPRTSDDAVLFRTRFDLVDLFADEALGGVEDDLTDGFASHAVENAAHRFFDDFDGDLWRRDGRRGRRARLLCREKRGERVGQR